MVLRGVGGWFSVPFPWTLEAFFFLNHGRKVFRGLFACAGCLGGQARPLRAELGITILEFPPWVHTCHIAINRVELTLAETSI